MENNENIMEPLLEKMSQFSKTSIELLQLKAVDKMAGVTAVLVSRSLLWLVISFFVAFLNIAAALWLGNLLGQSYYGFLAVAAFYAAIGIVLLLLHPVIKKQVSNTVVAQMLN